MRLTSGIVERYTFLLHGIGWTLFVVLPFLFFPFRLSTLTEFEITGLLPNHLMNNALMIGFFYWNLHRLTPVALRKNTLYPLLGGGLLCLGLIGLSDWLFFYRHPLPSIRPVESFPVVPVPFEAFPPPGQRGKPPFSSQFYFGLPLPQLISFVLVLGASSGLAMWHDLVRTREAQQQMHLEKVTAELAVLKLQISPHFLFNTLNNICWLARKQSRHTEEALVKLSNLLRYILYQADAGKVPLEREIIHLRHYIDLQTMRVAAPHRVTFVCEGSVGTQLIEPLLFVPFVENAFKHGLHSHRTSHIFIELHVSEQTLTFRTRNLLGGKSLIKEEEGSGIGIQNVQRRLALHYPDRHQLSLGTEGDEFWVELRLEMDPQPELTV